MLSFFPKVWDFIRHPTGSRTTAMIFILLLLIAIPLTVTLSQKQQSIRQRANEGNCYSTYQSNIVTCDSDLKICAANNCNTLKQKDYPDYNSYTEEFSKCTKNCQNKNKDCSEKSYEIYLECYNKSISAPPIAIETPTATPEAQVPQPPPSACNYNNKPDGCGNTSSWCLNGACTACTAGYLNCDQTQGCEISGNSCPAPTLTPTPSLELFNFYKEQVLKTTNLNELRKLLVDGINTDYIQFKRLTKEQYDILYNNYRAQYTKITSVQPTSPLPLTPTPIATPSIPVTIPSCSLKPKGDVNCDGAINILDFNIWLGEFIKTLNTALSDFNNDGIIDTRDFNIWRDNFLQQP